MTNPLEELDSAQLIAKLHNEILEYDGWEEVEKAQFLYYENELLRRLNALRLADEMAEAARKIQTRFDWDGVAAFDFDARPDKDISDYNAALEAYLQARKGEG